MQFCVELDHLQEAKHRTARIHHHEVGPARCTLPVRPHEGPQARRVDKVHPRTIEIDVTIQVRQCRQESGHTCQVELPVQSHHCRTRSLDLNHERVLVHGLLHYLDIGSATPMRYLDNPSTIRNVDRRKGGVNSGARPNPG